MSREELRDYVDEQRAQDIIPYHVYSALIDGIDTLEQEPKIVPIVEIKFDDDTLHEIAEEAVKNIEIEPQWIPVSERLPEKDGEYLATVYDTDENYKYMDIAELEDGIWQYKDYIKVIAWMPLPEPYKTESEE